MSAPDPTQALRVPGQWVLSPTSTAPGTSYPYGGTKLGTAVEWRFRPGFVESHTVDQGIGQPRRGILHGHRPQLTLLLQEFDVDALKYFLPGYVSTGTTGGFPASRARGGVAPGPIADMPPLLKAPYDLRHPALYVPRPMPKLDRMAELAFMVDEYLVLPLIVVPGPDSTGDPWQLATLEKLVLP